MILTEEEAKTKRCQEGFPARHTTEDGGNIYVPDLVQDNHFTRITAAPMYCLGSRCMAWRWQYRTPEEVGRATTVPNTGYCGKAGRP